MDADAKHSRNDDAGLFDGDREKFELPAVAVDVSDANIMQSLEEFDLQNKLGDCVTKESNVDSDTIIELDVYTAADVDAALNT